MKCNYFYFDLGKRSLPAKDGAMIVTYFVDNSSAIKHWQSSVDHQTLCLSAHNKNYESE